MHSATCERAIRQEGPRQPGPRQSAPPPGQTDRCVGLCGPVSLRTREAAAGRSGGRCSSRLCPRIRGLQAPRAPRAGARGAAQGREQHVHYRERARDGQSNQHRRTPYGAGGPSPEQRCHAFCHVYVTFWLMWMCGRVYMPVLPSTLPLLRKREFLLAITLAAEIHAVSWVAWPALALPAAPQNALVPGGRAVRFFRLRGGADDPATPPSLERGPQAASEGQGVGVTGADAIGCGGAASPMRELQERMRMGATSNASTSASGFKAKEYTFIPGFDGP